MKKLILMAVASLFMATTAMAEEEIGSVETAWNALGSNDRIEITRYDDPKVKGPAGGTQLGGMLEGLANTEAGQELLKRFGINGHTEDA